MERECTLHTTTFPGGVKQEATKQLAFTPDDGIENEVVNLYPQVRYQTLEGFGGAFTDAAGYVYSLMDKPQRHRLLEACYGKTGLGYTLGRIHLDSCDFALEEFQALEDKNDRAMNSFTLARSGRYILPIPAGCAGGVRRPPAADGGPLEPARLYEGYGAAQRRRRAFG